VLEFEVVTPRLVRELVEELIGEIESGVGTCET
jgi:hypothetical protein